MGKRIDYPFEIRPLSAEEGGGFLISYPDFSECLSDGETVEEALTNGKDALKSTIAALKARELPIPAPNSGGVASGKFVARVPKTVHARLAIRAKAEGVSLNTLVLTFIAEGLGRKDRHAQLRMWPTDTAQSDIDVMLIGENLPLGDILEHLLPLEAQLGRKINPTCYTPADFERRRAEADSFVNRILSQPVLPLIGHPNELGRAG